MASVDLPLADALRLAVQSYRAGRRSAAEDICRQILSVEPREPQAWYLLGVFAAEAGNGAAAVDALRRAIVLHPGHVEAHLVLGDALRATHQHEAAVAALTAAVDLRPGTALAHNRLAAALTDLGDLDRAEAEHWRAIESDPAGPQWQVDLGRLLQLRGRHAAAISVYSATIERSPAFAPAYDARATVLGEHLLADEALADHRRAVELAPSDVTAHLNMARTLTVAGDLAGAEACCRRALAIDPASAAAWESVGRARQAHGRFDDAAAAYRRSLDLGPTARVSLLLGRIGRLAGPAELARLRGLADDPRAAADDRVAAGFAVGKALDDADRFDDAFAAYAAANAAFKALAARRGHAFDPNDARQDVPVLVEPFTADYFRDRAGWGEPSDLPVFVVGMPRSGTTLVEQIAASHSRVFGAGERFDIAMLRSRLATPEHGDAPRRWDRSDVAREAGSHLHRLAALGRGADRVIDKMPANIFHLGLIATLFPEARVIVCQRDARDTCLSCFFQRFEQHDHMFSYDLADCGRQHALYARAADHWRRTLPLRSLTVQYEDVVADPPGQSRRLIEFLGLPWEPACLAFHQSDRPVLTASAWQVRQPISTRSVGRWERYQTHLAPLRAALAEERGPA